MAVTRQYAGSMESDTPRNRGDGDAPHISPVTPAEDARTIMINKVSWGAILAGVALALVTQLVLSMIGVGIGASTLDPGTGDNPSASGFSITAAIWWGVSGIIASFLGGFVAGRMAGVPKESTASWHGLTSWAVTTLVIFYLLTTTIGSLLGGTLTTLTGVVSGAANTAGSVAQAVTGSSSDPLSSILQSLQGTGTATTGDQTAVRESAMAAVRALLSDNPSDVERAREEAAQAIARARTIPIEQARTQVQQYEQQYRQTAQNATQQVTEAADTAATAVSTGALISAVALILGALAAWFGGRTGSVDPTVTGVAGTVRRRVA